MDHKDLVTELNRVRADLDRLLREVQRFTARAKAAINKEVEDFIAQKVCSYPGADAPAAAIRAHFTLWYAAEHPQKLIPSQKRLGKALRKAGFRKTKRNGRIVYLDIALTV